VAARAVPALAHHPALDGLRGVAVVAVLAFHGGAGAAGGALGVDLFLVLSGFLITTQLAGELSGTGRVRLGEFWARRARRLLPALLVVVGAVVVVTVVSDSLRGGYPTASLRGDALATLGYVANWWYVADAGDYFASFSSPSPLRHTWSLGVEEQWYVLWPVVLWGLHRAARGRTALLAATVAGLAVASAGLMWWWSGDVDRAHYGTDTRAQGLLVGAALAIAVGRRPVDTWAPAARRTVAVAGWAGAAVATWMILRVGGTTPWLYRGGHLAFAVAVGAVTAASLLPATRLARLLSLSWLRAAGLVSYGLYLWHWPIFIWLSPSGTGLERWPLLGVRLAASVAAAVVSYAVIEQPVRRQRVPIRRPVLTGLGASAVCAVLVVVAVAARPGSAPAGPLEGATVASPRIDLVSAIAIGEGVQAAAAGDAREALETEAAMAPPPGPLDGALQPAPDDGVLDVTVVGDSTGWTLASSAGAHDGTSIVNGAIIGCGLDPAIAHVGPATMDQRGTPVPCAAAADLWLYWATETDPDVVVLVLGAWEVYDRRLPGDVDLPVGTRRWRDWLAAGLESFGHRLAVAAPHARIVVADVPCYEERSPWLGGPDSPRNDPDRVALVNDVFEDFVDDHPARLSTWALSDVVCDGTRPVEAIDGVALRSDGVHVSGPGAALLWERALLPHLRQVVAGPPSQP
jgi:peptidoglycan/LPS O-acetylase OafA/YrhL